MTTRGVDTTVDILMEEEEQLHCPDESKRVAMEWQARRHGKACRPLKIPSNELSVSTILILRHILSPNATKRIYHTIVLLLYI